MSGKPSGRFLLLDAEELPAASEAGGPADRDAPSEAALPGGRRKTPWLVAAALFLAGLCASARPKAARASGEVSEQNLQGLLELSAERRRSGPFLVFQKVFESEDGNETVYHSAVVVCQEEDLLSRGGSPFKAFLANHSDFAEVPEDLWSYVQVFCEQLEFQGVASSRPGGELLYKLRPLSSHLAFHRRAFDSATLFLFGSSNHSAGAAEDLYEERRLHWNVSFSDFQDYQVLYKSGMTFTTHVLACAYGFLGQGKYWAESIASGCTGSPWDAAAAEQ